MELDINEALRYLGAAAAPEMIQQEMVAVAQQLTVTLQPRYTYRVCSLQHEAEGVRLQETDLLLPGETACRMLEQCRRAVLLACTLGAGFDTMLRTQQARDMARAAMLNACGSAWVEAGCDAAEQEIAARFPGQFLTDRFSPGYGDLPLSLQPDICRVLDAQRRLGIYVSETYLMNPVKSVTAVIGLADQPQMARIRGCGHCAMRETCALRKGGITCG